jgi:uncharacterized protein (TIGR02246 family)
MTVHDELKAFNDRVSAAMAAQDAPALAECYTDDARLLLAGQPLIRGRNAIAALFEASLAQGPHHMRFESTDVWEAGNIVVDVGTIETPRGTSKYVVVHERQPDGSLKMAVDAVTSDAAA